MTVAGVVIAEAATHRNHRWVIPAVFVWALNVILWVLYNGLFPRSDLTQVMWLALALTSLGLIGAAAMSGELDILTALARLKLGPWLAVGFSLVFGVATLLWLGDITYYEGLVTRPSLTPGAVVAGVGFLAFVFAYRCTPRLLLDVGSRLDRLLRGGGTLSSGALNVWMLWGVAMLAQAVSFAQGTLGYLADPAAALSTSSSVGAVLYALTQMGLLATLLAAWRVSLNRSAAPKILLIWVAGSQMILGLFSGMKEAAIIQLVALILGFSARGKLRLKPLILAGFAVMFVVTPFVTTYRAAVLNGSGRLSPIESLQSIDFLSMLRGATAQTNGGSLGISAERWSRIGDVAIIVGKTPNVIPYISSVELVSGPVLGFVPRSVWPGKPILDAGYEVSQQYYEIPGDIYNSVAVTPYGDLYRRGGQGVVIIGMAILGMFVRTVDDREGAAFHADPRLMFLPMTLFTALVKQEMDYLTLSASLVSIILVAALAVRLVSRRTVSIT